MTLSLEVTLRPGDVKEFARVTNSLSPTRNKRIYANALKKAGLLVQKIATEEEIVRGRGKDAEPLPDRLTSRTGTLARSIALAIDGDTASVGTDLIYGAVHEQPAGLQAARPFLSPALEKAQKRFPKIFTSVLEAELRRA